MQFRLPDPEFESSFKIRHKDNLFFIGSCFSENISSYFKERKFNCVNNPHGVLYNPVSVAKSISNIINAAPLDTSTIYKSNEGFQSFHHHSCITKSSAEELTSAIVEINKGNPSFPGILLLLPVGGIEPALIRLA